MTPQDAWVIDSAALIQVKKDVKPDSQWDLLTELARWVHDGRLYFPRQVTKELIVEHVDTPEAWALSLGRDVQYAFDPDLHYVEQVMHMAGQVADSDSEKDLGDPTFSRRR